MLAEPPQPYRSKTLAAWLALAGGSLGLHRIYLYGAADKWGWAHLPVTALGLVGAERMSTLGQDDRLSWLLIPVLGLMLAQAMLTAVVYALTPDERWDARFNAALAARATGWGPVLAAVAALFIGGVLLISTLAFSIQKFFEWQLEAAQAGGEPALGGAQKIQVLMP